MNLFDKLSKMDGNTIKKNINSVKSLVNTPHGQELLGSLNQQDRERFLRELNNVDVDTIGSKLNGIDKEKIAEELTKNPELLNLLSNLNKRK